MANISILPHSNGNTGLRTYSDTVARGYYNKHVGGLFGKHDNVRTYWEDQLTRMVIHPFVSRIASNCRAANRGVRVLDLGCGAGQGYELLTRINQKELNLNDELRYVMPAKEIGLFLGIDISDAMVEQGRQNYAGVPNGRIRAGGSLRRPWNPQVGASLRHLFLLIRLLVPPRHNRTAFLPVRHSSPCQPGGPGGLRFGGAVLTGVARLLGYNPRSQ